MSEIVLGKIGRGMAKKVPYDAVVEYIESTGTQWIDLGILPTTVNRCEIVFAPLEATTGSYYYDGYFGLSNSDSRAWINCFSPDGVSVSFTNYGRQIVSFQPETLLGSVHTAVVDARENYVGIDGVTATLNNIKFTSDEEEKNPFCLCTVGYTGGGAAGKKRKIRIYSARFFAGDLLYMDLVPTRTGSVGSLYDRAHPFGGPLGNGLYPNQGTDDFVVGKDVMISEEEMYKEMLQSFFNKTDVYFDMTKAVGYDGTDPMTNLNQHMFNGHSMLEEIYAPMWEPINYSLNGCTSLKRITIRSVFNNTAASWSSCTSLTDVTLTKLPSSIVITYATFLGALRTECVVHCSDGKDIKYVDGSWTVVE